MDLSIKLLSLESGNTIFSPANIAHAFGILLHGAAGSTANQIASIFSYDDPELFKEEIHKGLVLSNRQSVTQTANVFLNENYDIFPEYIRLCSRYLQSEVSSVNFADCQNAARKINKWVEGKTSSLIKDLVSPDMFNSDTMMAIVTAIIFKGKWKEKFEKAEKAKFETVSGSKLTDFMKLKRKGNFGFFQDEDMTKVIDIPYEDGLVMTVMMPENLNQFLGSLSHETIEKYFKSTNVGHREIELHMPKFKFDSEINLKDSLTKLGKGHLFDTTIPHDYSKMTNKNIYLSEVIHKATIEVDEDGTVASAATSKIMMIRCMPPPPIYITVDKPFIFLIRVGEQILFAGRVSDPSI